MPVGGAAMSVATKRTLYTCIYFGDYTLYLQAADERKLNLVVRLGENIGRNSKARLPSDLYKRNGIVRTIIVIKNYALELTCLSPSSII